MTTDKHLLQFVAISYLYFFGVSWITNTCDGVVICTWPKKLCALSCSHTSVTLCSTLVIGFISLEDPSFSILHGLSILFFFDAYL